MIGLKKAIEKHALANAVSHKGSAQASAVVGKILGEFPKAKKQMSKIMPQILEAVNKINELSLEEQKTELKKIWPAYFKKEKKEKGLAELPGAVMSRVVTRMPPEPGKYMTAGHALSFLISYLYAQKYNGKCILRFEDTNPENANQESVDSFTDGITRFLEIKPSRIVYVSDDILRMYHEIEKLINKEKAYLCSCPSEKISKLRRKKQACEHREQSVKANSDLWQKMISGKCKDYAVRLAGQMDSNNAVLRDPVIARINSTEHYRQKKKFCVWPTYDFANTCEDEWCGVTHVLRGIEFGNERIELQKYIAKLLGFSEKHYIQYGRFDISGLEKSSGRILRALAKKGISWDDPRMSTLAALERRGFVRETFYELAKQVGLSKTATKIDEKTLAAINRRFIDPVASRYFFLQDPIKISIASAPKIQQVKLKLHPERPETRTLDVNPTLFVEYADLTGNLGQEIRLKGLYNIQIPLKLGVFKKVLCSSAAPKFGLQVIQWLPKKNIKADVLMKGKTIHGIAEINIRQLKAGQIVQFERFGFCRLDKVEKGKFIFVFGHP